MDTIRVGPVVVVDLEMELRGMGTDLRVADRRPHVALPLHSWLARRFGRVDTLHPRWGGGVERARKASKGEDRPSFKLTKES